MEVSFNSFNFSPFTTKFPAKTCNTKNPCRFHIPISKFLGNTRSSPCYPFYSPSAPTICFRVSARFVETSRRRNSLRKKLIDDQNARKSSISSNPGEDSRNPNRSLEGRLSYDNDRGKDDIFEESKGKILGDSNLLNELEGWVMQYRRDAEYWGIGSGPIFVVFQSLDGTVEKVKVDEDEILRRNGVERLSEVNDKVSYAKKLAEEMENGKNIIPRNSSVAKFVVSNEESRFVKAIRSVTLDPNFIPNVSVFGRAVFSGFVMFWVVKKVFAVGSNKKVEHTVMEKEIVRRKMKARKEKEMLEKGSVEIVVEDPGIPVLSFKRPKLDEQELMISISKAKASMDQLKLSDSSMALAAESNGFNSKIEEIRKIARQAREVEAGKRPDIVHDNEKEEVINGEMDKDDKEETYSNFQSNLPKGDAESDEVNNENEFFRIPAEPRTENLENPGSVVPVENGVMQASVSSNLEEAISTENMLRDMTENTRSISTNTTSRSSHVPDGELFGVKNGSVSTKPRIIRSVKEAKEFLSRKRDEREPSDDPLLKSVLGSICVNGTLQSALTLSSSAKHPLKDEDSLLNKKDDQEYSNSTHIPHARENYSVKDEEPFPIKEDNPVNSSESYEMGVHERPSTSSSYDCAETEQPVRSENWVEKNFNEFEPIVEKIRVSFRSNYMAAREKVCQQSSTSTDITQLGSHEDDCELEWMKDDKLRDIVFRVRDNELAGLDPFHSMDNEDKVAFFQGLEKKVEKENEKLSHLHEWLHSNIENLDYGADGISLYDPPEKVIPRWKGPPLEKNLEFLNYYYEQRKTFFSEKVSTPSPLKRDEQNFLEKSPEPVADGNLATSSAQNNATKSKIVIEGSDGSVRPGKETGKEYWQHTKKWSREFLELYNAETDPEIKAIMKDMGKDLDRWITEEEVQEAADLMEKIQERNKKFMEKKINKLKREMELFGPQAVVSKYREYGEDREEDYLWWLDLPHVLCIELYTLENGEQRIGFYALEMAADLELEPKPCHVIAFEDATDCKNLCYIIQAHLDMLGSGNAFIVPRPPKDAFREAKENGFGVTVIRRGELKQLNVDQTLEEAEEQICEIGSKMYHDQIMKERSVDMSSLMKGVFGLKKKPIARKRLNRMLTRSSKKQS